MQTLAATATTANLDGVLVAEFDDCWWILCKECFDPMAFDMTLDLLGLWDVEDYEVSYDPVSRSELYEVPK